MSWGTRISEGLSLQLSYFAGHRLEVVCDTPELTHHRLCRPGTSAYSVELVEIKRLRQVVLSGDYTPGRSAGGMVSRRGYGLSWLSGACESPSYLAEKFCVESRFHPELAADAIAEWLADGAPMEFTNTQRDLLKEIHDDLRDSSLEFHDEVYERLSDVDSFLVDDGVPGWNACTTTVTGLVAVATVYHRLLSSEQP